MYKNSLSLHYVFNITSLRNQQNKTHMRLIATLAMGLALAVGMPSAAYAKKKKKAIDLSALKKDSVSDYKKLVKGATVSKGLFNVYFNKKTGKVYFEIPQEILDFPLEIVYPKIVPKRKEYLCKQKLKALWKF